MQGGFHPLNNSGHTASCHGNTKREGLKEGGPKAIIFAVLLHQTLALPRAYPSHIACNIDCVQS